MVWALWFCLTLRKLWWVICLWAGPFVLQIAMWDPGLWLLSRTFTLSQLSISERWNFQPPGKDAAHMTILYISFLSRACPFYKVKVAGAVWGSKREASLSSALCAFSVSRAWKLWPCSSAWINKISVTYVNGRTTGVHCKIQWRLGWSWSCHTETGEGRFALLPLCNGQKSDSSEPQISGKERDEANW